MNARILLVEDEQAISDPLAESLDREGFTTTVAATVAAARDALEREPPDVVLLRGNARQLMLLAEAAQAAGIAGSDAAMGRPTCAVLPQAINSGRTAISFGCAGNRVYTGADDNEAYFAIPGAQLQALEDTLDTIVKANNALEQFHRDRAEHRSAS